MTIEAVPTAPAANILERFFKIGESGSTISRSTRTRPTQRDTDGWSRKCARRKPGWAPGTGSIR